MKRMAPAFFCLAASCGGRIEREAGDAGREALSTASADAAEAEAVAVVSDAGSADADADADAEDAGPDPCADAATPPSTLECAGLYADFASQTLSPNAQPYAPAVPLWSDGATKERWIELPAGQAIDATDPNEWTFPIGTKVFKQFTYQGKRVETRLFQKVAANTWVHATYAWNADNTATTISYGATVPVDDDGGTWIIPTPDDCDSCHRGRSDRILGFEQVSLGLEGATGLTLLQLVVQDLITPPPALVNLKVGDDGTGLDAPALSWLHINCGVSCHNANENAQAYGAGMHLRLDPTLLDGTPPTSTWDPLQSTIDVLCVSGSVAGQPRIVPGDPSSSVVVQLMSMRGTLQMPPIASRFVDTTDVAAVADWIQHLSGADAGPEGGGVQDATVQDASVADTSLQDALVPDASVDAGPSPGTVEERTESELESGEDATPPADAGSPGNDVDVLSDAGAPADASDDGGSDTPGEAGDAESG